MGVVNRTTAPKYINGDRDVTRWASGKTECQQGQCECGTEFKVKRKDCKESAGDILAHYTCDDCDKKYTFLVEEKEQVFVHEGHIKAV